MIFTKRQGTRIISNISLTELPAHMINVDKIVTLSLKPNIQRQQSTVIELQTLALQTKFLLTEKDYGHEERGCFNAHLHACHMALQDPACQTLLIFEDDVRILPFTTLQIQALNDFLRKPSRFDIVYLGLILGKMWFCGKKGIVRARGAGAHAYILSRRGMEKLARYQYDHHPIDEIFKRDFKCYSVYPMMAEQFPEETLPSDITSTRNQRRVRRSKDAHFWKKNREKQKNSLWKNIHYCLTGG